MEAKRTEYYLPSTNGQDKLRVLLWESADESFTYKAAIQIVHGMTEHVERYDHFARYLVSQGFVVIAEDHIGHGKSVSDASQLGHIPLAQGKKVLIEDIHTVRTAFLPTELPYVIFGHSMGSFMARSYVARYGSTVAAAIICGTGNQPKALSAAGNALAKTLAKIKGETHRSNLIKNMADGSYGKAVENPRTSFDWLSVNKENVDAYIDDPLCGGAFSFTVGGYAALTDMTKEVVDSAHAQMIPNELPMLFIAGALDPVGDFGKGVMAAAELYKSNGVANVEVVIFPDVRHEILNEDIKEDVYVQVASWIDSVLEG